MRWIRLASTPSTQDIARPLPVGSVVVADEQTSGRGRLDRRWEAPPGSALLASFVLPVRPLASLAAGVAAAAACGKAVRLKWPNDLLLEGRKLGGVLVERRAERCVVGVGVNLTWSPPGAAQLRVDRDQLLQRLAAELETWFAAGEAEVLAAWRARADTLGRRVRVELPGETFEGWAENVAADGSLIVDGRVVAAGDVIHLRDAAAPEGSLQSGP
jgi:BirA family transcriptional regulator, biotin operon repressor / biotin---[acetyl-CoA-carboxylase] ligase